LQDLSEVLVTGAGQCLIGKQPGWARRGGYRAQIDRRRPRSDIVPGELPSQPGAKIQRRPILNGLINEYSQAA
jgi:hypothetical protein